VQPADLGHPALRQMVRGHRRRHPVGVRDGEDLAGRDENLFGRGPGALEAEAAENRRVAQVVKVPWVG